MTTTHVLTVTTTDDQHDAGHLEDIIRDAIDRIETLPATAFTCATTEPGQFTYRTTKKADQTR